MTTFRAPITGSRLRRAARVAAVALLAGLVVIAPPALADVPVGWSDPPSVSLLEVLLIFVIIPGALGLVITLLTLAPGLARGQGALGTQAQEAQWFGGRRTTDELVASDPQAKGEAKGGASGNW